MNKDILSNVNQLSQVAENAGKVADVVGANKLAAGIQQAQDKMSEVSNIASAGTDSINNLQKLAQQGVNLSSAQSLVDNVGAVANLVGNEKLAAKVAKGQKLLNQVDQAAGMAKNVIHRVQKITNRAAQAKSLIASNKNISDSLNSPSELLTALFKRPPSGLQFTVTVAGLLPTTFSVINFDFLSRYNDLFCLDVAVSSADSEIDAVAILDKIATLSLWQDGELVQTLSGIVSAFEQGDTGFRLTHYRLQIRPELWRATLRHNSRIFQQKDIQSILSTILAENKVTDYAFILRHSHPEREFCVQYRETDFDFFQRITAEEGIFYYFEQNNGQHRLILSDDAETLNTEKAVLIPYNFNKNAQLQEKCITTFNRSERVRPSQVQLKDYTFKKPNWAARFDVTAKDAENQRSGYEHYDFPGRFKDGRGKQYSQYRLDSLRQDAHLGWGESNSPQLQIGTLFKLQNHSNESLNTFWQLTDITYSGTQPQSSELESGGKGTTLVAHFNFIPREQTWRAFQQTKPRVDGPQMAIVVGPAGEEIYTDKFGRIRVQFLWDREGEYNDHSSCWIRVTQPWAGKGWGMMAIPRVGHEVLVDFFEGDPDQPIVSGRTYHANMPLPAGFPNAKPQMDLMSQTHKGGGHNGIMMDDATNGQRLNLHAQRNMNTKVLNNRSTTVKGNHTETVVGNQDIKVEKNRYKEVLEDETTTIKKNATSTVGLEYKLLVQGNISFESLSNDIKLQTENAQITLYNGGNIDIQGQAIQFNGEAVHLNPKVENEAEKGKMSEGKSSTGSSGGTGGGEGYEGAGGAPSTSEGTSANSGDISKFWTLTKDASPDGYIHNSHNGINSKATAYTAMYNENKEGYNASAMLLDGVISRKNSEMGLRLVELSGHLDKDFYGAKGKVVAAELSASHTGELGKTTSAATLFKGEAALRYKNHLGENGVFGLEREAKLSGSVLDAGVKHEFKNRYVDGKAGVSGAAGTAGGGIAGKALLNIKERTITVGGTGGVKFIIGGEVDSEVVIKYGNILDDIKSGKINMK